ncbi:MAG: hypothetical protein JO353_01480, partial [Phycisphaerae bacterium]|nr:hypothetical protein [Phycisphaerae bacterium]
MQRRRGLWVLAIAAGAVGVSITHWAHAVDPATQPAAETSAFASVDQIKTEAFHAFRDGKFDRSNDLLKLAVSKSADPSLAKMSSWLGQFESVQSTFADERHHQFDKVVSEVHKLLNAGKTSYATDRAREAYVLADDKDAFTREPWVASLIKQTIASAQDAERSQEWFKAVRLYSDLGAMEPANPEWKDKLKLASRRIRLLVLYTPDLFKSMQEAEAKDRDEADALINPPTTGATTKVARATSEENDSFRVDWHDQLKGIEFDMLTEALNYARGNYWREVDYKKLLDGGLKGMEAIATTPGLEKAFPDLADPQKR